MTLPPHLLLFVLLAWCGAATREGHAPQPPAAPRSLQSALVAHIDPHGNPDSILVRGTVAGHPVRFAVDTGASTHALAAWVVRRYGLTTHDPGPINALGFGASHVAMQVVDAPSVTLEGWGTLDLGSIVVVEFPPEIETWSLAGVIAPQRLATADAQVVLDVPNRTLSRVSSTEALAGLAGQPLALTSASIAPCLLPGGDWLFAMQGTVAGASERLIVDTGATQSVVLDRSVAGRLLAPRSHANDDPSIGLGGAVSTRSAAGVEIRVGDVRRSADVQVRGDMPQGCPSDGALGLDVLQDCVLVFTPTTMRARCAGE